MEPKSCSSSLFEHDLRANAFRVCREGKPVSTFPDHALERGVGRRWVRNRRFASEELVDERHQFGPAARGTRRVARRCLVLDPVETTDPVNRFLPPSFFLAWPTPWAVKVIRNPFARASGRHFGHVNSTLSRTQSLLDSAPRLSEYVGKPCGA